MKITDGKRTVEIEMKVWDDTSNNYSPDWSNDFFVAGTLETTEDGAHIVDDVQYCIDQAEDWGAKRNDYSDVPEREENEERAVFVEEA